MDVPSRLNNKILKRYRPEQHPKLQRGVITASAGWEESVPRTVILRTVKALLYFDLQPLREKIAKTIASFLARSCNFSCKNYSILCKKVCNSLLQEKYFSGTIFHGAQEKKLQGCG